MLPSMFWETLNKSIMWFLVAYLELSDFSIMRHPLLAVVEKVDGLDNFESFVSFRLDLFLHF